MMKNSKLDLKIFKLSIEARGIFDRSRKRIIESNVQFRPRRGIFKKVEDVCEPIQLYTCNYFFQSLN